MPILDASFRRVWNSTKRRAGSELATLKLTNHDVVLPIGSTLSTIADFFVDVCKHAPTGWRDGRKNGEAV
jgi:hypothetical protein